MNLALGGSLLAFAGTVIVAALTAWQARRGSITAPYEVLAKRVADLEASDQAKGKELNGVRLELRTANEWGGRLATQVNRLAGVLSREVIALVDRIESGTIPPLTARDIAIIANIREVVADLADSRRHDTGVPGTEED